MEFGNTLRIENIGSTSWKPLCSSLGHVLIALEDDDDDDDDIKLELLVLQNNYTVFLFSSPVASFISSVCCFMLCRNRRFLSVVGANVGV